jgi:hypothetical protein
VAGVDERDRAAGQADGAAISSWCACVPCRQSWCRSTAATRWPGKSAVQKWPIKIHLGVFAVDIANDDVAYTVADFSHVSEQLCRPSKPSRGRRRKLRAALIGLLLLTIWKLVANACIGQLLRLRPLVTHSNSGPRKLFPCSPGRPGHIAFCAALARASQRSVSAVIRCLPQGAGR